MKWVIGGTVDATALARQVDLSQYIFTVATEDGLEFLPGARVQVGRMSGQEMVDFIHQWSISHIIDMSHPFAKIVTQEAQRAAEVAGVAYVRYLRPPSAPQKGTVVESFQEALRWIEASEEKTFFFTTGVNGIFDLEAIKKDRRFIHRILPSVSSIERAHTAGVALRDLICMLGPFSYEMNRLQLLESGAQVLVTKDSGKGGGVDEKVRAAEDLGLTTLIIAREEEEGVGSFQELAQWLEEHHGAL
ncbi:MAG: precorrin-6A reductase [Tissierellia bacterium]|nr:precorrin-6A reductase [Tissierellia bacterium]